MINSSNSDLAVTHNSELAYILSNFNNDFIYSSVIEAMKLKIRAYSLALPNIVISCEENFKKTLSDYVDSESQKSIYETRREVYEQIIRLLCDNYQLVFNDGDGVYDIYTSAMYMYSLLVSDFQNSLISFFVNYILKEKSSIYEMLNLSAARKNKDSSTIYGKKIFKNPKIAVISANLDNVVDSIINTFNVDFNTYLDYIYIGEDKVIAKHLSETVSPAPGNDFIKQYIGYCFHPNNPNRSVLITMIRLALQQSVINTDLNPNTIIKEEQ